MLLYKFNIFIHGASCNFEEFGAFLGTVFVSSFAQNIQQDLRCPKTV